MAPCSADNKLVNRVYMRFANEVWSGRAWGAWSEFWAYFSHPLAVD